MKLWAAAMLLHLMLPYGESRRCGRRVGLVGHFVWSESFFLDSSTLYTRAGRGKRSEVQNTHDKVPTCVIDFTAPDLEQSLHILIGWLTCTNGKKFNGRCIC